MDVIKKLDEIEQSYKELKKDNYNKYVKAKKNLCIVFLIILVLTNYITYTFK